MTVQSYLILASIVALTLALTIGFGIWWQRAAWRTWKAFAAKHSGEFKEKNWLKPDAIAATIQNRPLLIETAINRDDDAPYYHTRAAVPVRNRAALILGIRRKSMLEEAQTRNDKPSFFPDDVEFERRFFVVANHRESAEDVLSLGVRRELLRLPEFELYINMEQMEWRRSGEIADMRSLEGLVAMLLSMAESLEAMPHRAVTLSERLADEELIARGV